MLPPYFLFKEMTDTQYIGRFAPSPSGELHFGSLIAALGSYLQARARQGRWLVRIEDIDPPREVPGAAETILRQLEHYGLHWDGDVLWQSQRHDAYREALAWLHEQGLSYYCTCTRTRIQSIGGIYDGHCRVLHHGQTMPQCVSASSIRSRNLLTSCAALFTPTKNWHGKILSFIAVMGCSPTTWLLWLMIISRALQK